MSTPDSSIVKPSNNESNVPYKITVLDAPLNGKVYLVSFEIIISFLNYYYSYYILIKDRNCSFQY
jgi:hypothetical protein